MNEHTGFDESFETKRLEMLLNQYAESKHAIGEVQFIVDEDGRLDKATWTFDDDQHALFQDSGFKWQLMELFDAFITYRLQHFFNDVSAAILTMKQGERYRTATGIAHGSALLQCCTVQLLP